MLRKVGFEVPSSLFGLFETETNASSRGILSVASAERDYAGKEPDGEKVMRKEHNHFVVDEVEPFARA